MTKKLLLINIIVSQAIILTIALVLKQILPNGTAFTDLLSLQFSANNFIILIAGSTALIALQILFHKYVSKDRLYDEINIMLLEKLSLPILFFIFLGGAWVEEILFRGVLQPFLGVWITSFLFTIIHFRYFQKIYILLEVYLMGLILGFSYELSTSLWVPILCHLAVNFFTAYLMKKGYLKY